MELNILCFIPFIRIPVKFRKERRLKYFLVQTFGSYILLFRGRFLIGEEIKLRLSLSLALILKRGIAPLHYWFPKVSEELEWEQYFFLRTLQKVAPLVLLFYVVGDSKGFVLNRGVILRARAGVVGRLNEVSLRKLLAYSSIHHTG